MSCAACLGIICVGSPLWLMNWIYGLLTAENENSFRADISKRIQDNQMDGVMNALKFALFASRFVSNGEGMLTKLLESETIWNQLFVQLPTPSNPEITPRHLDSLSIVTVLCRHSGFPFKCNLQLSKSTSKTNWHRRGCLTGC